MWHSRLRRMRWPNGKSISPITAVAIEGRVDWPRGAKSIYFRDPDGHLLELGTPGLWPNT
jgi:catechol 2,3-dioxygenase-like lactoylglutathione lyase family enzyme